MTPSFTRLSVAAAAVYFSTVHAAQSYEVKEEYTPDNFFSKFNFFVSDFTTANGWDPTHGFVNYRNQSDAQSLSLISTTKSDVYIGVNHKDTFLNADGTPATKGRDSVRIESVSTYSTGLIVVSFSHLPQQVCGAWPSFWAYGEQWLTKGEIDMYEGWNLPGYSSIAGHTDPSYAGSCYLNSSSAYSKGTASTTDCNNNLVNPPTQYQGTGCAVQDHGGIWSSSTGGTIALEITSKSVKVWTWLPGSVPTDVLTGSPKPDSSWGLPEFLVTDDACNIPTAFQNQKLVFNIDFCGDTAGNSALWAQSCSSKAATCSSFVAANPSAFADVYWRIKGIKVYQLQDTPSPSSSISMVSSTSSTPSSASSVATTTSTSSPILMSSSTSVPVFSSTVSFSSTATVSNAISSTLSAISSSNSIPVSSSAASSSFISQPIASGHLNSTKPASDDEEYCCDDDDTEPGDEEEDEEYCDDEGTEPEDGEDDTSALSFTFVPATRPSKIATASSLAAQTGVGSAPLSAGGAGSDKVVTSTGAGTQLTTVTIFSTQLYTITACPSTVSNCPIGSKTSTVIPVTTSVLPVAMAPMVKTAPISQFTTSTVYSTKTYTITSCAATLPSCPVGRVTTEIVALYTTVCPVTAGAAPTSVVTPDTNSGLSSSSGTNSNPSLSDSGSGSNKGISDSVSITSTIVFTETFTITSCASVVTDCPVGRVTSSVITTTTVIPATLKTAVPSSGSESDGRGKAHATTVLDATGAPDQQTQDKSLTLVGIIASGSGNSNTKTPAMPGPFTFKPFGSVSGVPGVAQVTGKVADTSSSVSATMSSFPGKATTSASSSKTPVVSGAVCNRAASFIMGFSAAILLIDF